MNSRVRSTPPLRPRLVALLDLDVVPDLRQVAIAADRLRGVQRDDLLVRDREHELAIGAVAQVEDDVDVVAPRALPDLRRVQHRHQHLLPADAIHLLADDLLHALLDPPAERQPRPHAGADLLDHAGAHEQLVALGDRVAGRVAQGREQVARRAHGSPLGRECAAAGRARRARLPWWPRPASGARRSSRRRSRAWPRPRSRRRRPRSARWPACRRRPCRAARRSGPRRSPSRSPCGRRTSPRGRSPRRASSRPRPDRRAARAPAPPTGPTDATSGSV